MSLFYLFQAINISQIKLIVQARHRGLYISPSLSISWLCLNQWHVFELFPKVETCLEKNCRAKNKLASSVSYSTACLRTICSICLPCQWDMVWPSCLFRGALLSLCGFRRGSCGTQSCKTTMTASLQLPLITVQWRQHTHHRRPTKALFTQTHVHSVSFPKRQLNSPLVVDVYFALKYFKQYISV